MVVKVMYLNDSAVTQAVYVNTMAGPPVVVPPADSTTVEVDVPEGGAVFVKTWGTTVLISHSENP